jgi:hypothetical protein
MKNITNFDRDLLNHISEILPFDEEIINYVDMLNLNDNQFMIVINDGSNVDKKYVITCKRWYEDD